MIIKLFSIPFPNLIIFVIEYLSRYATVMYQSLAMTTQIVILEAEQINK